VFVALISKQTVHILDEDWIWITHFVEDQDKDWTKCHFVNFGCHVVQAPIRTTIISKEKADVVPLEKII